MKKINYLVIVFICLFIVNVKADMGPPMIVEHDVMVTNKNGAQCYDYDGKKMDKVIPYGTTLQVYQEISGNYIDVQDTKGEYVCQVKYSDVSAKTQSFDLKNENVYKMEPKKVIILANGGLNLRKGPSVTYSKILTIPQYTVVTVSYQAGNYWYYTTYNGKSGWITAMNGYVGFEGEATLINYKKIDIYDNKGKVIGTIPANTEITNYLSVNNGLGKEYGYYVIYNNIKGYIYNNVYYKVDSPGKIKLKEDYDVTDDNGKLIKKITAGQELEYTMFDDSYGFDFYVPEKNTNIVLMGDQFEYIKKANTLVKKTGYLGEGLYGEKKEGTDVTPTPNTTEPEIDEPKEENNNSLTTKDIIIICLLGGIFLALTALVIIKLVNSKKNKPVIISENKPKEFDNNKEV